MRSLLFCVLFIFKVTLVQCQLEDHVSYESRTYIGSGGVMTDIQSTARFLSCKDGLLEFRLKVKMYDSLSSEGLRVTYKIEYDTIACFYLDNASRRYFQVDTFALIHKVVGMGDFKDKPAGLPIPNNPANLEGDMIPGTLRDSLVNGLLYKVSNFNLKSVEEKSSQSLTIGFIDDLNFSSVYAYTSRIVSRKTWQPVFYLFEDRVSKEGYMMRIESFKKPDESAILTLRAIQATISKIKQDVHL